ncbi:MAG: cytochrome c biogenesis protein CcdA, partial [Desulfovibrionaceae bacterium]|nr:cytochrome c biogenesis protein CcdA [Desulfovibrionaceae bacterium]
RDYFDAQATVQVYEGETTLFARLPGSATGQPYTAEVSLLLCSSRHCLPVDEVWSDTVPQHLPQLAAMPWAASWRALAEPQGQAPTLPATSPAVPATAAEPSADSQPLPPPEDFDLQLTPRYADESLEIAGLGKALLLGVLAGLLLNAMPCVLPVLTLKITGLLLLGGGAEGIRRFREHNICFAAGVMTLFTVLALILGMADLMWGQLYQSQSLILVMLLLVFLMGLSMLGVFSLPVIDLKTGDSSLHPRLQAYITGLMATFLATPCSGPLLGGVLGWAFTQPLFTLVTVFWAVGLGMALPYIVFSLWPDMARILPRPGAWMQIFERLLGFCLLGTALYLLSILPAEKYIHVLSVLLLTGGGAWFWGRFCGLNAPLRRRRLAGLMGLMLLAGAILWLLRPVAALPQWQEFTPAGFRAQLGSRPMLVEFTADWCPNCKFLESTVLGDERIRKWQARYGFTLVRVDLTSANAWAVRLLEALGSKSIPVTALFPAGEHAREPLVLRDVYGVATLERAMDEAFGQK